MLLTLLYQVCPRLLLIIRGSLTKDRRGVVCLEVSERHGQAIALSQRFPMNTVITCCRRLYNEGFMTIFFMGPSLRHNSGFQVVREVSVIMTTTVLSIKERRTAIIQSLRNRSRVVYFEVRKVTKVFCLVLLNLFICSNGMSIRATRSSVTIATRVRITIKARNERRLITQHVSKNARIFRASRAEEDSTRAPSVMATRSTQRVKGRVRPFTIEASNEINMNTRNVLNSFRLLGLSPNDVQAKENSSLNGSKEN